jgi:hypothetical protein
VGGKKILPHEYAPTSHPSVTVLQNVAIEHLKLQTHANYMPIQANMLPNKSKKLTNPKAISNQRNVAVLFFAQLTLFV